MSEKLPLREELIRKQLGEDYLWIQKLRNAPYYRANLELLRRSLGEDGHFTENTVALIAYKAAQITEFNEGFTDPARSKFPFVLVEAIRWCNSFLHNRGLSDDAYMAGRHCPRYKIKTLDDAYRQVGKMGFANLRETALQLTIPFSKP